MADRKPIESWLTDIDGVLIHEGVPIPGADAFIKRLRESGKPFLVLTNNSIYTPRDLHARLRRMGLEVPIESIWTSALATAKFLDDQRPGGSAYVIGEAGLTTPCTTSATSSPTTNPTTWFSARPAPTPSRP
ncbi:Dihydroxyacetone phosphatase [Streptomyces tendae]